MTSRHLAIGLAVVTAWSAPAGAQVADHLQCFKTKDASIVLKGTVALNTALTGPLAPCKISKAAFYCTGTVKSSPNVFNITVPITPLQYSGAAVTEDRICYKVSCPKLEPPTPDFPVVTDQFGQHNLTKLKTGLVCTPAIIGTSFCGDGTLDANEDCDGSNLGGASCVTVGYGSGSLACGPGCKYDVSACIAGAFPATGQTTCYGASPGAVIPCLGSGQDGANQAGATLAYQDNGDGTVTDLNTGLMWEKQSDDSGLNDRDQLFTWAQVQNHINALNAATYAGKNDWRLPNVRELLSIINYGVANPAVTTSAFHTNCSGGCTPTQCSCTAFLHHWSGTTATNLPGSAFTVNFVDGSVLVLVKNGTNTAAVRGVRGGPQ
jgi:hypothetical protein